MTYEKYLPPSREDDDDEENRIRMKALMYYDEDVCDSVKGCVKQVAKLILDKIDGLEDNKEKDRIFRTMLFMASKQFINGLYLKDSVEQSTNKESYKS